MRLVGLALSALCIEIGWLALWPLSVALSHSAAFTAAILDNNALARRVYELTTHVARLIVPGLPRTPLADPLGSPAYAAPAWALAVVFLAIAAAYGAALLTLGRPLLPVASRRALAVVLGGAGLFQVTLLGLPGVFSQDVFGYIAYGRIAATYQLNPYIWPPSAVSTDIALHWVYAEWRNFPCPYGPAWADVQWVVGRLFGDSPMPDQALAYRVLANVLLVANLALLWLVLKRLSPLSAAQRITALAALAWNPLVLFEVAANAHNDVLMVSFSLLALLCLAGDKPSRVLAGLCFTAGALVKYLSGIGLLWVMLASISSAERAGKLVRQPIAIAVACGTLVVVAALPWLELPDSLDPIFTETTGVGYANSLPDRVSVAVADNLLGPAGVQQARSVARASERVVVLVVFGLYLLWEVRRVIADSSGASVARATARSCVLYILLVSMSVQTWYFYLPVALSLSLGWRWTLARVTVGYSVLALPALYLSYYLRDSTPFLVDVVYGLAPVAPLAIGVVSRSARGFAKSDAILRVERNEVSR